MRPRHVSRPSSPSRSEERPGDAQKGETATASGRFPLPAIVACLALLLLLAAGCGGDDEGAEGRGAGAKDSVTVNIAGFKFRPDPVKVRKGGTVTFANRDKAPHTAQTDLDPKASEFDTKRLELGDEKAVKLDRPGSFQYFCAYHRFMEGTVQVVE